MGYRINHDEFPTWRAVQRALRASGVEDGHHLKAPGPGQTLIVYPGTQEFPNGAPAIRIYRFPAPTDRWHRT